ncbi:pseudouridine synthase [Spirosoma utsteinense]|uniref:tRNA pseudouridine65 synthase n=1 Tax=Spirosoma utsteinense TaxID=2585773 RepID=A0ABR6W4B1_9BACT|nr:tRNA pseudouridine65 synthase [Spirosoma utsteinense]MBC3791385.1 tRNA pseudouridine65 synthase [Spirosoma utsteinense]
MIDILTTPLPILYQTGDLVAINKPHGLLVHRSPIASDAAEFAVQLLRNQLGQRVYPVHRLDRKTGGVLLFALNEVMNATMQQQFMEGAVSKTYLAIVRGYTPDEQAIDYPLRRDDGNGGLGTLQDAFTALKTLRRTEVNVPFGKHPTSRYSLVELTPTTGRMHQLRKHMAHILHPIIGDRPHGCNKQNKLFLEQFSMNTMLLHARQIQFKHPISEETITVIAPLQAEFSRMLTTLFGMDKPEA